MSKDTVRTASFDLECTGLDASYGRLICACFKFHDEGKVRTRAIRWFKQEKALLEWIEQQLAEVDVLVSWNGKMFDWRFMNGRRVHHGLDTLPLMKHRDVMYDARALGLRGARLDGVAKDLLMDHQKIDVPAWRWIRAAEGDKESIDLIVEHCEQDVRMTQEAFGRLKHGMVRFTK